MSCISYCNTVFQRVDDLPSLVDATRNHAYILPDDTIWILNENASGFIQLTSKSDKSLLELLSSNSSVAIVKNTEGGTTTYDLTVDIPKSISSISKEQTSDNVALTLNYTDGKKDVVNIAIKDYRDSNTIKIFDDGSLNVNVNALGITSEDRIVEMIEERVEPDTNTTYTIDGNNLVGSDDSSVPLPKPLIELQRNLSVPNFDYYGVDGSLPNCYMYFNAHNFNRASTTHVTCSTDELFTELVLDNGILKYRLRRYSDQCRVLGYADYYTSHIVNYSYNGWDNAFTLDVSSAFASSITLYMLIPSNMNIQQTDLITFDRDITIPDNSQWKIQLIRIPTNRVIRANLVSGG